MGGRRKKGAEARPAELLEAALALFAEKGFAATRMEDIAARAGVSKGTVYLYFPSKQAVFEALVRQALLPNLERMERLLAESAQPAPALLRRLLTTLPALMQDPRIGAIPKLVIAEAGSLPEVARFYKAAVIDRGLGLFAALITRGVAEGTFRPVNPAQVAKLCVAPLLMAVIWRRTFEPATGDTLDVAAFVDAHVDILLRGLEAEGGVDAPA